MKYIFIFIAVSIFSIAFCCEGAGSNATRPYPEKNVICENLYQGYSIEGAIAFTGSPDDMREKNIQFLSRRGELAQGKALAFANRLFNVGRTGNVDDYRTLLSQKMNALLANHNKRTTVTVQIDQIRAGHAFSAACEDDFYGPCDAKCFVTFGKVDETLFDDSTSLYFPEKPTHQLGFFHFHKPNYMMIGGTHYVVEEDGDYKITALSFKNEDVPTYQQPDKVVRVKTSGIEKKTIRDISNKSFDEWHISLTKEDNKRHRIEIVRTSHVIHGNNNLKDHEIQEVVIGYDGFEKYANVWGDVRFTFRANPQHPPRKLFGPGKSGLDYTFSIATISKSASFMYPGMDISNIRLNEDGVFEDGQLELFSFDSIAEEGTKYRNSVLVRLTAKNSS